MGRGLRWERGEREAILDLIPDGPPFSATFLRQLLHNTYDEPEPEPGYGRIEPTRSRIGPFSPFPGTIRTTPASSST